MYSTSHSYPFMIIVYYYLILSSFTSEVRAYRVRCTGPKIETDRYPAFYKDCHTASNMLYPQKLWTFRSHHLAKSSKFTHRTCTIEVLHLEGRRKPGPSLYPEEENSRGWAVVRTAAGKLVQSCTRNDQGGWKKESELVTGTQWVYEVRILREIWPKPKGRRPGAVKKISGLRPATLNIASKPA